MDCQTSDILVQVALTFAEQAISQTTANLKCYVLVRGEIEAKVHNICEDLVDVGNKIWRWMNMEWELERAKRKTKTKRLPMTERDQEAQQSMTQEARNESSGYNQLLLVASVKRGPETLYPEQDGYEVQPGYEQGTRYEAQPRYEEETEDYQREMQSLFQEDDLPHPPGFPTPCYATKLQPPIRHSPRLIMKKNGGENKRAKVDKMRIDFDKRETKIEAGEALKLVEESGVKMTREIEQMFKEASNKEGALGSHE